MAPARTTPIKQPPELQIRTLAVEVIDGPDKGQVATSDDELIGVGTAPGNGLVLTDKAVSGYHLELNRHDRGVRVIDLRSTNGTMLGRTQLERAVVPLESTLTIGRSRIKISDGTSETVALHEGTALRDIIGQSPIVRRLMAQVERAAQRLVPTLLTGESGTGKEVFARALHSLSARANKPFVTVDCGAFSRSLIASEIFGHERGAFTGADRARVGAFERADGGVLFLDEIGELPIDLQPQLLGVIERKRFHRLGGEKEVEVDVQIVCATHRDLREEVNNGSFRLDLYYRIAALVLRLPSLHQRPEDIPLLVEHFLRECGHDEAMSSVVSESVMSDLLKHRWPGNVRELRNWVEATLAMGEPRELGSGPESISGSTTPQSFEGLSYKEARQQVLDEFEKTYLAAVLEASGTNVSEAARRARMDRSYLIKLLQRHEMK